MGVKSKAILLAIIASTFTANTALATRQTELISGDINTGIITFNGVEPKNSAQFNTVLLLIAEQYEVHPKSYWVTSGFNDITYYTYADNPCFLNGGCPTDEIVYKTAHIQYAKKPLTTNKAEQKIEAITKAINEYNNEFIVDDLSLVDYFLYGYDLNQEGSSHIERFRIAGNAANFSPVFKQYIKNTNVYPMLYTQGFGGFDYGLTTGGKGVLTYNGYAYSYIDANAPTKHVIFIPSSTQDTSEARAKAALDKINAYYKGTPFENKFSIRKVGAVTETYDYDGVNDFFADTYNTPLDNTDAFVLNYGNRELPIIIQKSDSHGQIPAFKTTDISEGVTISTESHELPYDSIIETSKIDNSSRKDIIEELGLTEAEIYDISAYSNTSKQYIKKLLNGKFEVQVPIGSKYTGRQLKAYHVTDTGEKEVYEVTERDGHAIFYTDHFSEYIIGTTDDNPSINNPATSDIIVPYIIALFGFVSTGLFVLSNRK